jgi:hypothetical protein
MRSFMRHGNLVNSSTATFLVFMSMAVLLMANEKQPGQAGGLRITLANGDDRMAVEAQAVVTRTTALFEELFHRPVESANICIRLVNSRQMGELVRFEQIARQGGRAVVRLQIVNNPGLMVRNQGFHVEGMTFGKNGSYEVKILQDQDQRFGRILAHEITHVLVRQTFGESANSYLNEGIAEYLAEKLFPTDVQRDRKGVSAASSRDILPYVEGLGFCRSHATDENFPKFFASQLRRPVDSGRDLEASWQRLVVD